MDGRQFKILQLLICLAGLAQYSHGFPGQEWIDKFCSPCKCKGIGSKVNVKCKDDVPLNNVTNIAKALNDIGKTISEFIVNNQNETTLIHNLFSNTLVRKVLLNFPNMTSFDPGSFAAQKNKIESLAFQNSKSMAIPAKNLSSFINLKSLAFTGSRVINEIDNDTFSKMDNAKKLKTLTLVDNNIRTVGTGAFNRFTNLKYLILADNRITNINLNSLPAQKLDGVYLNGKPVFRLPKVLNDKIGKNTSLGFKNTEIQKVSVDNVLTLLHNNVTIDIDEESIDCDCTFIKLAEQLNLSDLLPSLIGKCQTKDGSKGKEVVCHDY